MKRARLLNTLRSNLGLTEELLRFVQDCPDGAEWVKARVPPETRARVEHLSEIRVMSSDRVKHTES